jgi:hypothetical protein
MEKDKNRGYIDGCGNTYGCAILCIKRKEGRKKEA